eukprot:scaffold2266_cov166-Ochromonas_danica.AAC.3
MLLEEGIGMPRDPELSPCKYNSCCRVAGMTRSGLKDSLFWLGDLINCRLLFSFKIPGGGPLKA